MGNLALRVAGLSKRYRNGPILGMKKAAIAPGCRNAVRFLQ
jgi:hypothetical protein